MSTLIPTPTPKLPVQKQTQAGVTILAVAAAVALLYYGRVFFITIVVAITIAFLLDPLVTPFLKLRMPRSVASFIVCSVALLVLYLLGLGLYTQFAGFEQELPTFSQRMNELVDNVAAQVDDVEKRTYQVMIPKRFQDAPLPPGVPPPETGRRKRGAKVVEPPPSPAQIPEVRIHTEPTPLLTYVYGYMRSFYDVLLMASFVPFLVYFMLSWRDHMRRSFLYLFSGSERQIVGKSWQGVADMVRAYVIGNFILGLILATISCSFFFAIRLPYWPLVGPLSGFLSLVPYVGLPLAMMPPLAAGLIIYNQPTIYVMIALVVAMLHLIAMNLLYPKVVGSRVHLNPLVVTVALMFWGTIWGGVGLLLAIPITAGIKAVCDNVTSLHGYGRLLGD
ncbi:MAG TPA: AI-2E family transporter [Bryobacteraceae bacterium]|jgi:predicted PurR-regulated permease PerM|nr:AI-2E family transporter [Bryobacteraceae bacterium]